MESDEPPKKPIYKISLSELHFPCGETSVQTFFKDLPPEGCDPETAVAQHQSLLQRLFSAAYEIQQLQQDAEAGTRGLHN